MRPGISIIKINWNYRCQGQVGKIKEEGGEEESKPSISQFARHLPYN